MNRNAGKYLDLGGGVVFYEITGKTTGAPIVLLDGLGCDGFIWPYIQKSFRRTHQFVHVHYRGHGRSPVPQDLETLTIEQLAQDAAAILDREDLSKAVVMGHSLGVQVAVELARIRPELVSRLVLLCGAKTDLTANFYRGAIPMQKLMPTAAKLAAKAPLLASRAAQFLFKNKWATKIAKIVEVNGARIHDADMEPYFRGLARIEPRVFWTLLSNAAQYDPGELSDIRQPTLVIAGDRDRFIPVQQTRILADDLEHAELMVVSGGSHVTPLEFPRETNARIHKFLGQKDASR